MRAFALAAALALVGVVVLVAPAADAMNPVACTSKTGPCPGYVCYNWDAQRHAWNNCVGPFVQCFTDPCWQPL